jgi:hypothetical protein
MNCYACVGKGETMTTRMCKWCLKPIEADFQITKAGDILHQKCFENMENVGQKIKERNEKSAPVETEKA